MIIAMHAIVGRGDGTVNLYAGPAGPVFMLEVTENSLYAECVKRGIPMSNHESDLYIPVTAETRELIKHFDASPCHEKSDDSRLLCLPGERQYSTFINQVEGGLWFDVAFAFLPWWEQRAKRG
jgi:hypothetical protein